jgi:SAM-dependent methyltransferase
VDRKEHWAAVYGRKPATEVSWYAPTLVRSLALITERGPDAAVIDVGAGASTLVDDLLASGYHDVTLLDVSAAALGATQERLGPKAASVNWIVGDVTAIDLEVDRYDVWHDRAVFHFLTASDDRAAYARLAAKSTKRGGCLIIATFAPDGPARCSGLETVRYDGARLAQELPGFTLKKELRELHRTPSGAEQQFMYALLEKA